MPKMKTTITGISGIGPDTARTLHEHGFNTLSAVAAATIEQLCSVPGFGTTRASRVIRAANELLAITKTSTAKEAYIATRRKSIARKSVANTTKKEQLNDAAETKLTKKERKKAEKLKKEGASKEKHKKKKNEKIRKKKSKHKK
jgi:NAD-dependent DNA ligase